MAKNEEAPTTKQTKPVRYENTSNAIAWLPTFTKNARGERIPDSPQLVVPGRKVEMTDEQFAALSPEQWGVEIANEKCRLYDVPEAIEKRIDDAVEKERARLEQAKRTDFAVRAKREKGEEFRL